MQRTIINLGQTELWSAAISKLDYAVGHTHDFCRIMAGASGLETFLYLVEEPPYKLVCPLSVRRKEPNSADLLSPFGFGGCLSSFPPKAAQALNEEWKLFCRDRGIVTTYIVQHPCPDIGLAPWFENIYSHHRCYIVDLRQPIENLWQSLSKTHRYEIRKCEASSGLVITKDKSDLEEALQRLYPSTIERVGASSVYNLSSSTLSELCNLPDSLLVGAGRGGEIEAVSLFLYSATCGEYFINAASPSGRLFSRKLIWESLCHLSQQGVKWCNLGGGIQPGDSLEQFKRGFGGAEAPLISGRYIADTAEYERLCLKYCDPASGETDFFPPYWRSNAKKYQ